MDGMTAELSLCPGCHATARHVKMTAGMLGTMGYDEWRAVSCTACGLTMGQSGRRFRSKEDAAKAWNKRVVVSPPVPDTAAKSTHPADVSKSSEEINTKAATPVAPPEAPSPELLRVHQAGTILSNIAFNLAQRPGEPLDADQVVMLDGARREWDAACAAFKSAREAYRMAQQTTTEGSV